MRSWSFLVLTLCALPACSGEAPPGGPACSANADCAGSPDAPLCEADTGTCVALPPGHEIGFKDGSPGSVALVPIYQPDVPRQPVDLAFNPAKPTELWILNYQDGSVIIVQNPGVPEVSWERRRDPAAAHFINQPPALAFGVELPQWGMTWGTCGDNDNGGSDFMGPALFSADLDIFAKQTADGLGSHLDMLHSTSFCRGIAHEQANVYWVFNSDKRSLDKYDFKVDHGPGADDHADGVIRRYVDGLVYGVEGIPSHVVFDPEDQRLYVAETGRQRIVELDTTTGTMGATFSGDEPADRRYVDGAVLTDVVPAGTLQAPSGIELHDGLIYVTDNATSQFHVFDREGQLVRSLYTGLPPGSLAGFTFGPDGRIYFTDKVSGWAYRIDPLF